MLKIIVDFDNTVAQSNKAIIQIASKRDGTNYNTEDIKDYSFSGVLSHWNKEDIDNLFVSKEFFDNLEPFPNAVEVINKLRDEGHEIMICTVTRKEGIIHKGNWIYKHFGYIPVLYIDNFDGENIYMSKHMVTSSLILDDHIDNLNSAETIYKVAFGRYAYNKSWEGQRCNDWEEFYRIIKDIEKELNFYKQEE